MNYSESVVTGVFLTDEGATRRRIYDIAQLARL